MRIEHSESINELAKSLCKAQSQIKGAVEDSSNPHFKSKYASLQSYIDAAKPALAANGLAVVQLLTESDCNINMVTLTTMLMHESGQWIRSTFSVPIGANMTAQAFGSACTYARRYSYAAIVGIAPIDDDGNQATASMTASTITKTEQATGVKKLPPSVVKFIASTTDLDALMEWGKEQDPSIQQNTQFRTMFQNKMNELKTATAK